MHNHSESFRKKLLLLILYVSSMFQWDLFSITKFVPVRII